MYKRQISGSPQSGALGSAIFGIAAADPKRTGYDNVHQIAHKLGKLKDVVYQPILKNSTIYDSLFAEYQQLHDYFGKDGNQVMKRLKKIKMQYK